MTVNIQNQAGCCSMKKRSLYVAMYHERRSVRNDGRYDGGYKGYRSTAVERYLLGREGTASRGVGLGGNCVGCVECIDTD